MLASLRAGEVLGCCAAGVGDEDVRVVACPPLVHRVDYLLAIRGIIGVDPFRNDLPFVGAVGPQGEEARLVVAVGVEDYAAVLAGEGAPGLLSPSPQQERRACQEHRSDDHRGHEHLAYSHASPLPLAGQDRVEIPPFPRVA